MNKSKQAALKKVSNKPRFGALNRPQGFSLAKHVQKMRAITLNITK
jgi:hypothetical protein